MKLKELKGIIYQDDRVTIIEAGKNGKAEDYLIKFSEAVKKYGSYYVWWIEADSPNCFNIIIDEDNIHVVDK